MVTLTDIAAQKVGEFLSTQEQAEAGLRVAVRGGGCSGFQYQLALDEQREGDRIFEYDGIRIIVDEMSLRYVDGSTVDYTESLMGAGFQVNNPNVVAACGCGSSFRVAGEEPSCRGLRPTPSRAGSSRAASSSSLECPSPAPTAPPGSRPRQRSRS